MLRLMYRLTRKRGAVLFTVIAVMALLIAMATAAYYTARASYNTVVNNYDYSQLYLSATNAADMVIDAVMNEPVPVGGGTAANIFTNLQTTINDKLKPGTTDHVYVKSNNITIAFNGSTKESDVVANLRTANPVEPGVLDGLTLDVELRGAVGGSDADRIGAPVDVGYTRTAKYAWNFTYTITTTAYYRDSYIKVQDVVRNRKIETRTTQLRDTPPTPGPPGTGGADFTTFFTSTGQKINLTGGENGQVAGEIGHTQRVVTINMDSISDGTYFQNERTYIKQGRDNEFKGALSTYGSLYIDHGPKNNAINGDWFIGEDLVVSGNGKIGLTSGHNLYVGGDLILMNNQKITADNIYVAGNVYFVNGAIGDSLSGANVKINGNVYFSLRDNNGNLRTDAIENAKTEAGLYQWAGDNGNAQNLGDGSKIKLNGKVYPNKNETNKIAGKDVNTVKTAEDLGLLGWNINDTNSLVNYKIPVDKSKLETGASDTYGEVERTGTVMQAIAEVTNKKYAQASIPEGSNLVSSSTSTGSDGLTYITSTYTDADGNTHTQTTLATVGQQGNGKLEANQNKEYASYTAGDTAYKNVLDLSATPTLPLHQAEDGTTIPDEYGNAYYADVSVTLPGSGETVTVHYTAASDVGSYDSGKEMTVKIPNVANGIALKLPSTNQTNKTRYEFQTGEKAMPVVLLPNMEGDKFSWSPEGGTDVPVEVALTEGTNGQMGNVVFEMATKNKNTGKYEAYKIKDDSGNVLAGNYTATEYIQNQTTIVGTSTQLAKFKEKDSGGQNYIKDKTGLVGAGGQTEVGMDNHVMLVSNAMDQNAYSVQDHRSTFFGYVYAPNGTLNTPNTENNVPIIGGLIVSTYDAGNGNYVYSAPKPSVISNMISSLSTAPGSYTPPGTPGPSGKEPIPGSDSSTYAFGEWNDVGNNYIG